MTTLAAPVILGTASLLFANNNKTLTVILGAAAPAGSWLVATVLNKSGTTVAGMSDDPGNQWLPAAPPVRNGNLAVQHWMCAISDFDLPIGAAVNINGTNHAGVCIAVIRLLPGVVFADILIGANATGSGTAISATTGSLSDPDEIVIAGLGVSLGAGFTLTEAGYSNDAQVSLTDALWADHLIVASRAASVYSPTLSASASWAASLLTFQAFPPKRRASRVVYDGGGRILPPVPPAMMNGIFWSGSPFQDIGHGFDVVSDALQMTPRNKFWQRTHVTTSSPNFTNAIAILTAGYNLVLQIGNNVNPSGASFTGAISDGAGNAGTILTVTAMGSGSPPITPGNSVLEDAVPPIPPNVTDQTGVAAQLPGGTPGGVGTYTVDPAQLVASEAMVTKPITNGPIDGIYGQGKAAFQAQIATICDTIAPYLTGGLKIIFQLQVQEDQNGSMKNSVLAGFDTSTNVEYLAKMEAMCEVLHSTGDYAGQIGVGFGGQPRAYKSTNGAITPLGMSFSYWWQFFYNPDGSYNTLANQRKADAYAVVAFTQKHSQISGLLPAIPTSTAPFPSSQLFTNGLIKNQANFLSRLQYAKYFLANYVAAGVDYLNINWTLVPPAAYIPLIKWVQGFIGVPVLSTALGQHDPTPLGVIGVNGGAADAGMYLALQFVNNSANADPIVNPDGSLLPGGVAYGRLVQAPWRR